MLEEKRVLIIRESLWRSLVGDIFTMGSLSAAVGLGVLLDSQAMQWIGGVIWIFVVTNKCFRYGTKATLTLDEAKAKIEGWIQERDG